MHRSYQVSGDSRRDARDEELRPLFIVAALLVALLIAMAIGFGVRMEHQKATESSLPALNQGPTKKPMPDFKRQWNQTAMESYAAELNENLGVSTVPLDPPQQLQLPCPPKGSVYKDCQDAKSRGHNVTGLVTIKPDAYTSELQVYCDMESDGGGWTLVASIHEDNFNSKCGSGDKWSKSSGRSQTSNINDEYENWFNLLTFGDLFDVTGDDYKNRAMYSLNASDVMIWHVPNDVTLSEVSDQAFFKYHTTSGFLSKYGSNLHQLFTKYYPMNKVYPKDLAQQFITCLADATWSSLWSWTWNGRMPEISIQYDDVISVKADNGTYVDVTTSDDYTFGSSLEMQARLNESNNKFSALLWFPGRQTTNNIDIKVDWGDFAENYTLRSSTTTYRGYTFKFGAVCGEVVCKILFLIFNPTQWGRGVGSDTITIGKYKTDNESGINMKIRAGGQPLLVAYAAFRRKYSSRVDSYDWSSTVDNLPTCFDQVGMKDLGVMPSLSVPASFIKGEMNYNLSQVTPGFIEFRKYDNFGFPFPICPGIRLVNDADPAQYCIGGINYGSSYGSGRRCGDFSAWNDLAAHSTQRATTSDGREITDMTSSLLLFYR